MAIVCIVWQKLAKKRKTKTIFDLQKHCLNEKPKAGYPTVAKPKRLNKNKCMFFFSCVYFSLFVHCVFNYVQFCSFLFTCCSVFSFIFMLFISFHFLHFSSLEKQLPIQTTCMSTHYLLLLKYSFRKMHIYIYIFIHIFIDGFRVYIFIDGFRVFQPPQKHRFA